MPNIDIKFDKVIKVGLTEEQVTENVNQGIVDGINQALIQIFDLYFNSLSISNIAYDENLNITEMIADTGNKLLFTYDGNGNILTEQYTDTDGTTVILTKTYGYDGNGNLTSIVRS